MAQKVEISAVESAKAEIAAARQASEERARKAAESKGNGERNVEGRVEKVDVSIPEEKEEPKA